MPIVIPTKGDWKNRRDARTVTTVASPTSTFTSSDRNLPPAVRAPICAPWTKCTQFMHHKLTDGVTALALQAARRPRTWITVQTLLSLGLLVAGLFGGGFRLELDIVSIFNPLNSKPQLHNDWIVSTNPSDGAFGDEATRTILLFLHNNGHNVLHTSQTRRVLEAVEVMQSTPGMTKLCAQGTYLNFDDEPVCRMMSVAGYWNTDDLLADYDASVRTDHDVRVALASNTVANGSPIVHDALLGNWKKSKVVDIQMDLDVIEEEEAVEEVPTLPTEDEVLDTDFGSGFATNPRDPMMDVEVILTNTTNATSTFNQTHSPMMARSSSAATTASSPEFIMSSAQSYFVHLDIPQKGDDSDVVEDELILRLDRLRLRWIDEDANKVNGDPTALSMDIKSAYAYQMESMKLIQQDMYLAVCAAMVVVVFTCLVFYSPSGSRISGRNQSRMLLGVASIWTITMSLLAGCGIMFLCGIPYTSVNQMLPYIIYGIGLDDTFIITGAFFQLDPSTFGRTAEANKDTSLIERKIQKTLQQVGWSICLTTLTTVIAFLLGYFSSSFPGVRWLCLYAVAVITIDFFFQVTYFVAFLVLDEERVQTNRRDCCFCLNASAGDTSADEGINFVDNNGNILEGAPIESAKEASSTDSEDHGGSTRSADSHLARGTSARNKSLPERVMQWYSGFLLRPPVKVTVLVIFTAYFGWCCYSTSLLEQHFDLNDYVSDTSYLKTAFGNIGKYSSIVREMQVYFRNVDQTDPEVQKQMVEYINDLEALHQIGTSDVSLTSLSETGEIRPFCWVRDFQEWEETQYEDQPTVLAALANMTFLEKLNFALTDKTVREVYGQDIVRDESGNITASRCTLFLRDLDLQSVPDQIEMLLDQREVTAAQPMNNLQEHKNDWAFFCFDKLFFFWESSAVVIQEMIFTTIAGVVAVAIGKPDRGMRSCMLSC